MEMKINMFFFYIYLLRYHFGRGWLNESAVGKQLIVAPVLKITRIVEVVNKDNSFLLAQLLLC